MSKQPKELNITFQYSIFEKIFLKLLKRFKKGKLNLTLHTGEIITVGDGDGLHVDMIINDVSFYKRVVMFSDIGFAESYMDGEWQTSSLKDLIRWIIQNIETSGVMSGSKDTDLKTNLLSLFNKVKHKLNRNSLSGSKQNISYHYDISNELYKLMLDDTMAYSSAVFEEGMSLHEAQLNKFKTLCEDLDLKEDDHILEIGCGWGGLAIYAAKNYGCKVTGLTISKEQYEFAIDKIKAEGLEDKITILFDDYRTHEGQYSKIVSIEMIEAVGDEFLDEYFSVISRLMAKDGVVVIQAITSPDSRYDSFKNSVDFIQKHIFPGSLLPSVSRMVGACKTTDLQLINLRDIGLDYAKTLGLWRDNFFAHSDEISELGLDEVFFRKWNYYLEYCEAAFYERNISTVQVTFIRPNNTSYKHSRK